MHKACVLPLQQMKIAHKGIRWVATSGVALLIFVQGCGTSRTSTPVSAGQSASKDMTATGMIEVCAVQYAMSTGGEGDETVEVLFRNNGGTTARFVRVTLDGAELPPIKADVQAAAVGSISAKGPYRLEIAIIGRMNFFICNSTHNYTPKPPFFGIILCVVGRCGRPWQKKEKQHGT